MSRYVELQKLENKGKTKYFAAQEVDECVSRCVEKIDEYYNEMNRTGRINLYRNSYFKFYQAFSFKGSIYHSGAEGELMNSYMNHYANLITHATNMVCQQKLSYEPQATTTDADAQDQIKNAKGILYVYANRTDMDVDGKLREAVDKSQVFMEAYVAVLWNKNLGKTIAYKTKENEDGVEVPSGTLNEGDNEYSVWTPFDVIVDTTLPSNELKNWLILRKWENKFDVAAEYPAWENEVTELTTGGNLGDTQLTYAVSQESDLIPVYYLLHKKTTAVPNGRLTKFVDDHIILADGELPYREIPLFRIAQRDLWGSPFGYSRAADVLPLQDTIDRLVSCVITNQLTFATQNILIAKGSSIDWENLYGGLNVIEWDASLGEAGKPSALQLTATPPEVFNFLKDTITNMGTLMGINEVVRGNPDLALKGQVSGAALALMSSNSIQFNSDLNKAYVRLAEQVGTATVHNLQDFGFPELSEGKTLTRDGMSASANNKYVRRSFTKSDIDKIDKILVRYGNPLAQTTSGRMQIAESLLAANMIPNAKDYLEVVETGNLQSLLEAQESQLHLIKEENESLLRGEVPPVLWCDNHPLHIPEHLSILSNLEARKNPKIVKAVQVHVQQHQQFLQPPMPAPMPGAPAPGGPPPGGSPSGGLPPLQKPGIPTPNNAGLPQNVPPARVPVAV